MDNVFDLYGVKEVSEVTFYDTVTGLPELFLDTLKLSTIEETASESYATGGQGNSQLIGWDYGKEITLNLEDALFSMKSMALSHGSDLIKTSEVSITKKFKATQNGASGIPDSITNEASDASITYVDGQASVVNSVNITSGETYLATWKKTLTTTANNTFTISADKFPGTYTVVGTTYARNKETGKDEFFTFIIPLAKMSSEKTITMQADGDPSTFTMTLKVLRPDDKQMVKFVKY